MQTTIEYPPEIKFWEGENYQELGYRMFSGKNGYNRNMPGLYFVKDGNVFKFDYCFHMWDFEKDLTLDFFEESEDYYEVKR